MNIFQVEDEEGNTILVTYLDREKIFNSITLEEDKETIASIMKEEKPLSEKEEELKNNGFKRIFAEDLEIQGFID